MRRQRPVSVERSGSGGLMRVIAAGLPHVVIVAIALVVAFAPASPNSDLAGALRFFAWIAVGLGLFSLICAAILSVRLRRIGLAGAAASDIVALAMFLALGAGTLAFWVLVAIMSP